MCGTERLLSLCLNALIMIPSRLMVASKVNAFPLVLSFSVIDAPAYDMGNRMCCNRKICIIDIILHKSKCGSCAVGVMAQNKNNEERKGKKMKQFVKFTACASSSIPHRHAIGHPSRSMKDKRE